MSGPGPAGIPMNPAWQAYADEEHRIRDEYLAAVSEAHRQYDLNVVSHRETYATAERSAWQTYYEAGRANWRTYRAALSHRSAQADTAGLASNAAGQDTRPVPSGGPRPPQPVFTPATEGGQ